MTYRRRGKKFAGTTASWMLPLLLSCAAGLVPHTGTAAAAPVAAPAKLGACGPMVNTHGVVAPPQDIDIWKAPVDASGQHELILAAHTDDGGKRFCYVYQWHGVVHYVAPAIHMRRGETFAIRLVNDLDGPSPGESVPSTAIPPCKPMTMPAEPVQHWVGYLDHTIDDRYFAPKPIDTNLHLHGFEGPASEENVFLSTLSTPMHACEYNITIPDTQPPGTYIYHPHAHGAADAELGNGLVGVWIVDPDAPQLPRDDQHVVLLTYRTGQPPDQALPANLVGEFNAYVAAAAAREAALKPAAHVRYDPFDPPPSTDAYPKDAGGVVLHRCGGPLPEPHVDVDGADAPATLRIQAGRTQLLRLVNGTADSPKLLSIRDSDGHALPFEVVERDGVPVSGDMQHPYARYQTTKEMMLSPMSRAAILLTAPQGAHFVLSSEPWCNGITEELHHDLLHITAINDKGAAAHSLHSTPIATSDTPAARLVAWVHAHPSQVRRRAITFTEYVIPKHDKIPQHYAYYITDTTHPDFHEHTFWPVFAPGATVPSNPDIVVQQGTIEVWYLINATQENHDFHIHQMKFVQERNYNGMPMTVDTVFQPLGKFLPNQRDPNFPLIQPDITKVILDFRHVPKGTFVFHCHMLSHEDLGMMGTIRVE